jgi:sulfatase maturation enzyme AslB (radical SAM superfamily)
MRDRALGPPAETPPGAGNAAALAHEMQVDAPVAPAPAMSGAAPGRAPAAGGRYPFQPLLHLDALWIQVAGTVCNLRCTHCFVSCGPGDDRHAFMTRDEVRGHVADAVRLGVKEFYFTGGEPFLHPEITGILADTLASGPCTVLTNGTLFTRLRLEALRRLSDAARYALEIRVSLDGPSAEEHDRFRGAGSFARTVSGLARLAEYELLPLVTATHNTVEDPAALHQRYETMLRAAGLPRPRLKLIPMFRHGREAQRSGGYAPAESLLDLPPAALDPTRLQCHACRAVTSRGVYVCPLLVDEPGGRMGDRLDAALGPFELRHGACSTCYATGMTCGNG